MSSAALFVPDLASAEAMYRWKDVAGRLHFSNVPERVPAGAEAVRLRELSIERTPSAGAEDDWIGDTASRSADRSDEAAWETPDCGAPDPSRLIEAVTSRLESTRDDGRGDPDLTLFIAATPVWYDERANVRVWPGGETDETAAIEQAAIAFPASGTCPPSPPLERYAVNRDTSVSASSQPGLCADYRQASAEIDIALSRNENVARTFEIASARFESLHANDGAPESAGLARVNLPPWLVEVVAAQTGELAAEIEDFMEELTVAREAIDGAAEARGCW